MLRILTGVSLCFTLVVAAGACSSESTGGGQAGSGSSDPGGPSTGVPGTGGSGTGSGTGGSGTGGSDASSGGGNVGRAGSSTEGGRAGAPSTGGNGSCTLGVVTCVDAATAATCDESGQLITINCVKDFAEIGIISTGCVGDAKEGGCDGEAADEECFDGALLAATCSQYTEDQFYDLYIACFQNAEGIKPIVQCLAPFLPQEGVEIDCVAARAACIEDEGGAGGAGG